ncbi:BREX-1 system adenine-specific DNA-methyltransferase PglX [Caproiciproducens faecalis]|uniref:site-specific DNA-methyltransferase (adenine-specific) n=1 Tax=Caproiciproducens faecalis TaxID=2820301 RepID=A0ABS7DKF0_9FIRM|nr:BREX-1 system adenine-specific DNA-methyltransferase PglX [Caproiciproducens faecalis]
MNKAAIKAFAVDAREKLIASVSRRAIELTAQKENPFPDLTQDIETIGFKDVVEEVAYTWFIRLIGVRFMEVNGYLPGGVRVLSSETPGRNIPDILAPEPQSNQTDERFTAVFFSVCRSLTKILPEYFGSDCGYLEPLLQLSFSQEGGIVRSLVDGISEEDFREAVEIIGWLYQYYNDARRSEVISLYGGRVKKEDVPAATQFFTTDWVVRSMVDNSLGQYWLERNPGSALRKKLEFYLGAESASVQEQMPPQELKILDPCMGSGHILVYAFDLLIEIYGECGISPRDAAELILRRNLCGFDIDRRSWQLACFALLMKARRYNEEILNLGIPLNLYVIREGTGIGENLLSYVADGDDQLGDDLHNILSALHGAAEYGSLLRVEPADFDRIFRRLEAIRQEPCDNLFSIAYREDTLKKLLPILRQARAMAEKYTVVATNPPYLNRMNKKLKSYINQHYRDYSGDLFSVFIYRNFDFCTPDGYCAFMSPFVWMFIKSYQKLREYIIQNKSISSLIQLEYSAFDEATVPICTFVLKNGPENRPGVYLKLSDFRGGMEVQKQKVMEAVRDPRCAYRFETSAKQFARIPGMPIAYWAGEKLGEIFSSVQPLAENATVTNGLFTCDNKRFLRFWYEVDPESIHFHCTDRADCLQGKRKWYPYNKGGDFRKWYGNQEYVVNFQNFGREISEYRVKSGQSASFPGQNFYFEPSVSWSFVSSSKFGVRYYPQGFVFDIAGSSVFPNREEDLYYILGFLSSSCAFAMLNLINPTLNYQAGNIARLPLQMEESIKQRVSRLVAENIAISKEDWDSFETSWNFDVHPLIHFRAERESSRISDAFAAWKNFTDLRFSRMKENEEELNRTFIELYGLQNELSPRVEDGDVTVRRADLARDIRSFLSFAVGCLFGRYTVPGFDARGGTDVLPVTPYLENDLAGRVVSFVKLVFGEETLDENLAFIASALGGSGSAKEVIRSYYQNEFYREHIRIYKKRPIYWLLDGGAFQALCYQHHYDENTLDHALSFLEKAESGLEQYVQKEAFTPKQKEKLAAQLTGLRDFGNRLEIVAKKKIRIDLDDGVLMNYTKVQGGETLFPPIK